MISIIITSYKEPRTIGRAIEAFLKNKIKEKYEILVVAPDKETLDIARQYSRKNKEIKVLQDPGKGKPTALALAFKEAKGDFLVLSDGDVFVSNDSVNLLLENFKDKFIGGVTARVVSTNPKDKMLGYWAYLLTSGFHEHRMSSLKYQKNTVLSGYLYAMRGKVIKKIPENSLADDAVISHLIQNKGYKTTYEPRARVFVKYPTNLQDWISQKKRTAGRIYQLSKTFKFSKTKSFFGEINAGMKTLSRIKTMKQVYWFIKLSIMKFYIWYKVLFDYKLRRSSLEETWTRIESTK